MRGQSTRSGAQRATKPASFELVFRAYFHDVFRLVGHQLGPGARRSDVEDVTQLVFEAAFKAWPRFRGDSKVRTWLFGVAYRVVLRQLRSFGRQRRLLRAVQAAPPRHDDERTPERHVAAKQQTLRVWSCLMRIAAKKRTVYVMHDIEDRTATEIAEFLGVPRETVRSRLRSARAELVELLRRLDARGMMR